MACSWAIVRSVLPSRCVCSLTPAWVLGTRDTPELSLLFTDPITEKQKTRNSHQLRSSSHLAVFGSSTCGSRQPGGPAAAAGPAWRRMRWWPCSAPWRARHAAAPTTPGRWTGSAPPRSPSHNCQGNTAHAAVGGRAEPQTTTSATLCIHSPLSTTTETSGWV